MPDNPEQSLRRLGTAPQNTLHFADQEYPPRTGSIANAGEYASLYEQHVVEVYRYHHARTGSVSDAQDLTAETFHAALENYPRYQSQRGTPIAWLMGIARHKLADHFRRAAKFIPLDAIPEKPADQPSPEMLAGLSLRLAQVAAALCRINPSRAEAVALHLYVGLSLEETGQVMKKSPQAVKKLVQRGLADLRRSLQVKEVEE